MTLQDLIEYCQAEAISNKLSPTHESVWRQLCRRYSKAFNTPLPEVLCMEPMEVILNVYEEEFDEISMSDNMENILDLIYGLEDPEYARQKRDELKDFIRDAEEEEEIRQETGRPIHRELAEEVSIKNSLPTNPPPQNKTLPKGGGINLSYLENEESEGGFDE